MVRGGRRAVRGGYLPRGLNLPVRPGVTRRTSSPYFFGILYP